MANKALGIGAGATQTPTKTEWHAHAETYPLLQGEEYESFKADINAHGVQEPVLFRVAGGKKQYLDGRNRQMACKDLGVPCPEKRVEVADKDVKAFIDSHNLHRRHLTAEQRQARVKIMRAEGQSIRQIADTVGVSPATVHADLNPLKAGVQNRTPAAPNTGETQTFAQKPPATVVGKDSKTYPAQREPGDDTETEKASRKAARDQGKPIFDDRKIHDLIGKLTRAFDERANALGKGKLHESCIEAMRVVFARWTAWQKS